jgi:hypothetical protein
MYVDNKMVQIHILFNEPKKLLFAYIQTGGSNTTREVINSPRR